MNEGSDVLAVGGEPTGGGRRGWDEHLFVPISALRHYRFCVRRCALQYVEETFRDNAFTLEGNELHERVDDPATEQRQGVRVERALPLFSDRLGLSGRADVVEFHRQPDGTEKLFPVEYKRGVRRPHDQSDVQLCAQGMCLEEMFGVPVDAGAVYFGAAHRRRDVVFEPKLRAVVKETTEAVRSLIERGATPPAILGSWCDGCSLRGLCMPEVTSTRDGSSAYLDGLIAAVSAGQR